MKRVYIGKIVSFHGVKGEMRILSSFEFVQKAFLVGTHIFIDEKEYTITSYRHHKQYEMITLDGFNTLNQVLLFKGKAVYKEVTELSLLENEVLEEELLTFRVLTNEGKIGMIKEIFETGKQKKTLRILVDDREYLIPYQEPFIKKIDRKKKEIEIEWIAW